MLLLRALVPHGATSPEGLVAVPAAHVTALARVVDAAPATLADELRAHHDDIARAHAAGPCLPARFGRVYADDGELRAALDARGPELARSLADVGDRSELEVTLSWRTDAPPPDRSSGAAFLRSLRERERRRGSADALVARLLADLHIERTHVRHETCPAPGVAASVALLTTRDEVTETMRRVNALAAGLEDVTARVFGPLPPYSFAS